MNRVVKYVGYHNGKKEMSKLTPPSKWVETYADPLYNYAKVRVGERETAKDLVQETFLSALRGMGDFKGESSEKTWLFSILKNKIIDHYRKKGAEKEIPVSSVSGSTGEDYYFDEEGHWKSEFLPVDWGASPEEARSREFLDTLQRCLARLTAQCRGAFTLKYIEEMDSDEVCKELAVTSSNYWVIIHRAKLQLRHCLQKNWLEA